MATNCLKYITSSPIIKASLMNVKRSSDESTSDLRELKKLCLDSSRDLFQDSFEHFDDRKILDEQIHSEDFSSIASGGFSQICDDPQIMMKIDEDIRKIEKSDGENTSEDIEEKLEKLKQSIINKGNIDLNISLINEADLMFDNIEKSIRNDSQQSEANFSGIFKSALLENANRVVSPSRLVNLTLPSNSQPKFNILGNFYGLPDKIRDLLKAYRGITELYDWQNECLSLSAISERKNLVYALPTSGGKTLVAEVLILRELLCRKKNAIFVLPYVAIVQEKVWALSPFAVSLNFLIEEYAGGKGTYPPRKRRRKNSVYIATIEKALGLINSLIDTGRLDEIGLVVIDELHLIGEPGRGSVLEELLTKLVLLNDNIHIVGMSATIGNLGDIEKFLNADLYTENFRPVELTEYIQCENRIAKINWKAKSEEDLLVEAKKKEFCYTEKLNKLDPDRLGGLVMEVAPSDSCLIFCSSKKSCENVVLLLCKVVPAKIKSHKSEEKSILKRNLKEETGDLCEILGTSIDYGIAYHHSGLTSGERKLIEDSFREGTLCVICCTSTLAAGVNLPARRVILRQPYVARDFISMSRYKQMVGRAGRAGFGSTGESILICSKQDLPKVHRLIQSPMDEALSAMHLNSGIGLRQLLLSCISLNIANTRAELHEIVKKTLIYTQETKFGIKLSRLVDKALSELFKLGALDIDDFITKKVENELPIIDTSLRFNNTTCESDISSISEITPKSSQRTKVTLRSNSKLKISKLGLAAIKGGLELTRAHRLYEDLLQAQASLVLLNSLHLLYLVTPYDISEQITLSKSRYYTFYTKLTKSELQTAKILGITESCAIRLLNNHPIKSVPEHVLKRFYVTLILYDLWNEKSIFEVAEKYEVPRGLAQTLMTSAASFSSNVVNFCMELKEFWCFAYLLKGMMERLQHCCIKELVPLMELPSVKQCRAKQLYDAGYRNLPSIAKANPRDLVDAIEHMSIRLANQLIAAAKLLLLEKVENLHDEVGDVLDGVSVPKHQI